MTLIISLIISWLALGYMCYVVGYSKGYAKREKERLEFDERKRSTLSKTFVFDKKLQWFFLGNDRFNIFIKIIIKNKLTLLSVVSLYDKINVIKFLTIGKWENSK
jgi:hypothetical protein